VTGFVSEMSIKQDYTDIITDNFDLRGTVVAEQGVYQSGY
jgi:hypothetical protein